MKSFKLKPIACLKKFAFLVFVSIFVHSPVFSQRPQGEGGQTRANVIVRGLVLDALNNASLPGAHVTATSVRDTTRIFRGLTNERGNFEISLPRGNYNLTVTFVGYEPQGINFRATDDVNNLGNFMLGASTSLLQEAVITGEVITVTQRGDTIAFNAAAFQTNPDASAEDLVRKMPGITVEGGQVTAQGEQVRRVLVDGREFFGDDPNIALRNLTADMVAQIEVFDQESDQARLTGFADGQEQRTINIVTRHDRRSGQFGRVYSGYGENNRYQGGLVTNIFHGSRRISILGMTNNINQQNFSAEDISSATGSTGGRGGRMGGGGGGGGSPDGWMGRSDFATGNQAGVNRTNSIGVNYTDKWFDRIDANFSYFFNLTNNDTERFSNRQFFFEDNVSQYFNEINLSGSRLLNHRFSGRMEYEINENNTLIFTPRFSFRDSRTSNLNTIEGILYNQTLINDTRTENTGDGDLFSLSNNLTYRLRLSETGRSISARFDFGLDNTTNLSFLQDTSAFFRRGEWVEELVNQRSNSDTRNLRLGSNITYTEPVNESSRIELSYNLSFTNNESNRLTNRWDVEQQMYSIFVDDLSSELTNGYVTHRGGLTYGIRGESFNLQFGASFQNAHLQTDQLTPYIFNREYSFNSILPTLRFNYNFSRTQRIRVFYRTSTSSPSANQLQDVIDNTNPLFITTGNPELKQSYTHNGGFHVFLNNPLRSTTFMFGTFASFTNNFIATSSFIARELTNLELSNGKTLELPAGGQFSKPTNLNGFLNVRSWISYGFMFRPIRTNINFNASTGYSRTPGMLNDRENFTTNLNTSAGIVFASNISPSVDFTLSYTGRYNIARNEVRPQLDNNFFTHTAGARLNIAFLKNFVVRNDVTNLLYTGLGDEFNQNYWLWNANIGYKFLEGNQAELTLGVYDLLDQNNSISRNITGSYIEDLRTNVLNRYFMLTLTYNLRNFRF